MRQVVAQHRQRLSVAKTELEQALGKSFSQETLARFVKKTVDSRLSVCENARAAAHAEVYALKVEGLKLLEAMSECGWIDLLYGDESRVSLQPCVPYAWQFKGEEIFMPSTQGQGLNCFALLSRANECRFETTTRN